MSTAPEIASTLSPEYLTTFINSHYNLGENVTCKLFRTGINHTYFVTGNNKRYVLRVYCINWRTVTEIEEEIRLLNLLKNGGIHVSYPILDKDKEYIHKLNAPEGLRYAVLFAFAEGDKVRHMTEKTCETIGYTMAKMHKLTVNQPINRVHYTSDKLLHRAYNQISDYFNETLEEMQYLKNASILISPLLDDKNNQIREGIVHLDLWYDNMATLSDNEITFFDFDNCGNGKLVLDVGYFLMQLFDIEFDKTVYEKKAAAFLTGYQKITPLTEEEKKLMPYGGFAIWQFYLGVQASRFDWSNIFLSENYLKMFVARMKRWMEYNRIEIS